MMKFLLVTFAMVMVPVALAASNTTRTVSYIDTFDSVGQNVLPPSGISDLATYGSAVVLNKGDGNTLAVGQSVGHGAVHIYTFDGSSWDYKRTFQGTAGNSFVGKNFLLSKDGSRIAIRGYAGGKSVLQLYDVESGDSIGTSLSCGNIGYQVTMTADGRLIALSCERVNQKRGVVEFYYLNDNEEWIPRGSLLGDKSGDHFGWSTSISDSGERIAISAPGTDTDDGVDVGSVGVYDYNDSTNSWDLVGMKQYGSNTKDMFGNSVALSGNGRVFVASTPGLGIRPFVSSIKTFIFFPHQNMNMWIMHGGELVSHSEQFDGPVDIDEFGIRIATASSTFRANAYAMNRVRVFNMNKGYWVQHSETFSWPTNPSDPDRSGISLQQNRVAFATSSNNVDSIKVLDVVRTAVFDEDPGQDDRLGANEWNIDVIDVAVNTDKDVLPARDIRAVYEYKHRSSTFAVYESDCMTPVDFDTIITTSLLEPISSLKDRLTLDLEIDRTKIASSPVFQQVDKTKAMIHVCLRVDLLDEETMRPVVSEMNHVHIEIETLERFELTNVETVAGESIDFELKLSLDYDISACQCNELLECHEAPLSVDEDARICVQSETSAVDIAGIQRLKMSQGSMSQTAIREGDIIGQFAKVEQVGKKVVIYVRLVSGFFNKDDPEDVVALGVVQLKFKNKNRLLSSNFSLRRTAEESSGIDETGFHVGFRLLSANSDSSGGFARRVSFLSVTAAVVACFCFV